LYRIQTIPVNTIKRHLSLSGRVSQQIESWTYTNSYTAFPNGFRRCVILIIYIPNHAVEKRPPFEI
ncbi:MAG TPA: hypothetical protein VE843_12800, partial [Ktedonobacteraceae bacterium]|nr:hypothetical protein [Ktedonobacteraceae bacterium]